MRDHDLGWFYEPGRPLPGLTTTTVADRRRMQDFALRRFTKQA